ncbi:hypothetical protein KUH03_28445 [Sphingobacterium sp. E70]|uniref:hypothetical protein n=1 Tax=Sphingobacterium sp. E70 TaxID=2853439 RepID=UPI00211CCB50|nr:hypothetical protein [Sphingobacterium sp. E70]ULT23134.1 hypothetical protein KUH03_28445 [Sphingobacterium sp. E70]
MIHSSWGGTIIEAWMSREALTPFSIYTAAIEKSNAQMHRKSMRRIWQNGIASPNSRIR